MSVVATFEQHGKEQEQYFISENDVLPYEQMGHITNLEIKEADYDEEIIRRLDEVKSFPASEAQSVELYVLENELGEDSLLALKKQNEALEQSVLELSMMKMGGVD